MDKEPISLSIAMTNTKYRYGSPLIVEITFTNSSDREVSVTLPAGADKGEMFSYKLIQMGSAVEWSVAEFSPKSFYADWQRTIPPRGQIRVANTHFRYSSQDGYWLESLPVGRYRLICVFDQQKAIAKENRLPRVLQSNAIDFTVRNDAAE